MCSKCGSFCFFLCLPLILCFVRIHIVVMYCHDGVSKPVNVASRWMNVSNRRLEGR